MDKIKELREKLAALIAEWRGIVDKADEESRDLSEDEDKRCTEIGGQIDTLKIDIAKRERLVKEEGESRRVANPFPDQVNISRKQEKDPDKEFRNVGEYFFALASFKADGKRDARLEALREKREQTMGTGATGGFALPDQFDATVRQVQPQDAIVRPRASVIPAGSPPDAELTFPALDQTSAQNVYGGVVITHTGEGVTMTETTAKMREVKLEPKELSAYIVVTLKLLNNWDACSAFVQGQLRKAMNGAEDYDFLRGDGINKAIGIINSAAAISYSRAGANAIAWADVYNMYARAKMGGSLVWIGSQTIVPQLASMVDTGSHAVWISGAGLGVGASQALPSTLMGLPLIFADRLPALGTKGDLNLVDLSYYIIKDGSGPIAASSEHIMFTSNKVVFKIVWNVDGKPWLTEPLGLEGSTTNTVSPFVVLN